MSGLQMLLRFSLASFTLFLCSCMFRENLDELGVKGCVAVPDSVIYVVTPYGGSLPERLYLGDFDSLDGQGCFNSSVAWKSGGETTVFGIPIARMSASAMPYFSIILNGKSVGAKNFTFDVDSVCKRKMCDVGVINY